ncbi:hypothetical protein [Mesobacillus subterraneus]|uniref:Type 4 fimbrial biogenesis protein PilX N-terminal domain-containing protein n=1 Tax=Mesobacillus subterraneus TaxID=285983 RepID=A0A3R9FDW9_9BACI|nr:hypothetical protein [Mesobacillus subterraneus]RSD23323.1 hypothetical protein EJA10_20340 [Mesobacillus subterraneus]
MVKNEKGYALVLVLLIITITFTFALSLSGMALSARKQFNKTDEVNRATDLAEMGVAHYEALLANIVKNSNIKADEAVEEATKGINKNGKKNRNIPVYDDYFFDFLKKNLEANRNLSNVVENPNSYAVTLNSYTLPLDKKIIVEFTSVGRIEKESKTLSGTVTITKNSLTRHGEDAPLKSSFAINENNSIEMIGNYPPKLYKESTYFERSIDLRGKNSLTVTGDAFFKDKVSLKGTDTIVVHGDAIFSSRLDNPSLNGNSTFCVYGNTYYTENDKLVEYNPFPSGNSKSCPSPLDEEWFINPEKGIEVKY